MITTARDVIDRLKIVFNVHSDSELCRSLDLPRTTVSTWIGRDSVPYALCVELALKRGLSLDWLLTGDGNIFRTMQEELNGTIVNSSSLTPRQQALLGLFDALEEDQQREILTVAEEKKRLNQVEAALEAVLKKLA